jgi:ribosome recycling factor
VISDILTEAELKMDAAVEYAKEEFAAIRTGRAHPAMFAKLTADYYGAPTPLQQLASFQTPEARTILISPFDKGSMHAIEKAIQQADLGVNPSNDGTIIRCVMPVLTEERRREYVKMAHTQAEDAKVSVRNIRRHAKTTLEKLVKDGEVGEDEGSRAEKELETVTKKHVDQIDDLLQRKETELLDV